MQIYDAEIERKIDERRKWEEWINTPFFPATVLLPACPAYLQVKFVFHFVHL